MSSALGGITAADTANATNSNAFAELSSEEFVRIMTQELANQDPFEPNDSAAILEQLSSLRNIESQIALQDQIESLVLQNGVAQAGGLIGKLVEGLDTDNNTTAGLVTSVRIVDGEAQLELDNGKTLPIDRVTRIAELDDAA